MKLHHTKHHQTYVNGLNAADESYAKARSTKERIGLQAALKFNGGGKYSLSLTFYLVPFELNAQAISTTLSSGRTLLPTTEMEENSRMGP